MEEHWKCLCERMKVHSNLSSKHIEPSSVDASNFLSNSCCWKKKPSTGSKMRATCIMDLHRVPAVAEDFSADAFLNLGFDQCRPGRTPQRWWKHLPTPQNWLICYWQTLPEDVELFLIPPAELSWGNQPGRSPYWESILEQRLSVMSLSSHVQQGFLFLGLDNLHCPWFGFIPFFT